MAEKNPVFVIFRKIRCNEVDKYGKKEAGTGEHLTHLIK